MQPQFSVIIPTLNEEKFLPLLLQSLADQTQKNFEVIVIDGQSTDKTVAKAKVFQTTLPSLTILKSDRASLPYQRNLGAKQAVGEWLVFVDADSILLPYFFSSAMAYIQREQPKFMTTWCRPDSEVGGDALFILLANATIEGSILINRPLSPGPLTMVHCDAFHTVGTYNEALKFGEDLDLSQRLSDHGFPLKILRETLYIYSMRRYRKQGTLKVMQTYAIAGVSMLLTKRPLNFFGYAMGGHLYGKKSGKHRSVFRKLEAKVKQLMKEVLE